MTPETIPGTRQVLFTFARVGERPYGGSTRLVGVAHRAFRPLGLFLLGATSETYVLGVFVGHCSEVSLNQGRIPGRYFQTDQSMEELQALAEAGEIALTVQQRQMLEMETAEVGNNIAVEIEGPFEDVCLWGLTYEFGGPVKSIVVEPASRRRALDDGGYQTLAGFRGQIIERRLGGDCVTADVHAPSEASVCQLIGSMHFAGRH